jgi:hypothetical protein
MCTMSKKTQPKAKAAPKAKKPKIKDVAAVTPETRPDAPETPAKADSGKLSGLDAAAKVLADAGEPLNAKQMIERMTTQGLWTSDGKTPHATIYAAIIREISKKGAAARFKKTERGLFTVA